jgi:DNA-binding PadR family transcriptional regulator
MERQLLLLGMLMIENMHGYQLNEQIEHHLGFFTDLKKPTLYYTLDKLEKQGYIQQETEREGNRPERHVYELTERGRARFFALLRRQLGGFSRVTYADDIAISLLDYLPIGEARDLLTQKRDQTLAALDELQALPPHEGSFGYVLAHHIAHLETEAAWLDGILQDLEEEDHAG